MRLVLLFFCVYREHDALECADLRHHEARLYFKLACTWMCCRAEEALAIIAKVCGKWGCTNLIVALV
jgi:hypothetical protein